MHFKNAGPHSLGGSGNNVKNEEEKAAGLRTQSSQLFNYIGDWREGSVTSADPNREIGFGFVSCSCRACVRACEAA